MTEQDLKPIFNDVKFAPSAFNLQHTEYLTVLNPDVKEQLREAAYGQYKVHSASAVIIVTSDRYAYKKTAKLNEGMKSLASSTTVSWSNWLRIIQHSMSNVVRSL